MKRLLIILCVMMLLSGAALADECDHNLRDTDMYRHAWIAQGETHFMAYQRMSCCTLCGTSAWRQAKIIVAEEPHNPFNCTKCSISAQACNHHFQTTNERRTIWISTSTHHTQVLQQKLICALCRTSCWLQADIVDACSIHDLILSGSWHNHQDDTHTYTLHCSVCGYIYAETIPCDGPPCLAHPSAQVSPE